MNGKYQLSLVLALVMLMLAAAVLGASAAGDAVQDIPFPDQRDAAAAAVAWLVQENQNPDGGFGVDFATGDPASSVSSTLDAVLAMASVGYSADALNEGSQKSAIDYLKENASELRAYAEIGGGANGKIVLALTAANKDPRTFTLHDFVAQLIGQYDPSTGSFNNTTAFDQALSIQALKATGEPVPGEALEWLIDLQASDGSWDDGFGTPGNSDTSAMAIMALVAGGREITDPSITAALSFLQDSQLETGGWEYGVGFGENANSTALVVQALSAAGENFYAGDGGWAQSGVSPLQALLAWQSSSGAFQADFGQGRMDNFFATAQAVPAVTGKPYPLPSRSEAARAGVACLVGLQDQVSGGWEQFAGFGVNAAGTSRAIEAIAAAGENPQAAIWMPGSISAIQALENETDAYLATGMGGAAGVVAQGVVAAGDPYTPLDFAGRNLPQVIDSFLNEDGQYDDTSFGVSAQCEAMLGLLVSGAEVDQSAVDFLLDYQTGGDWGGPDGNGIALNVLGRLDIAVPEALTLLRSTQQGDGGWGFAPSPSNPSSTSEALQGLVQQDENPFSPAWSQVADGRITNPADVIMNQQQANGCWLNFNSTLDDPFSTTDAIVLLSELTQPEPFFRRLMPVVYIP